MDTDDVREALLKTADAAKGRAQAAKIEPGAIKPGAIEPGAIVNARLMNEHEAKQAIGQRNADVMRAEEVTPEIEQEIAHILIGQFFGLLEDPPDGMFTYQPWDSAQTSAGTIVRQALAHAVKVIVENVPPCPDRSTAIRKIREAYLDCNSAITFRGRY